MRTHNQELCEHDNMMEYGRARWNTKECEGVFRNTKVYKGIRRNEKMRRNTKEYAGTRGNTTEQYEEKQRNTKE